MDSRVKIEVVGKNINNYINRLIRENISILSLNIIGYDKAIIVIKYSDYLKLIDRRSIYKINIINRYGLLRIRNVFKKGYIFITCFIIGIIIIILLSNVIFNVSVIHSSSSIKDLVYNELNKYGLKKYSIKKSYDEIESIEDKILNDNKDRLEWIEIEVVGTKYVVRVEERKIKVKEDDKSYTSVVMGKSGILKKIFAFSGEKKEEVNTFQKKDKEIISGSIVKPNGEIVNVHASGVLYAEVWYKVNVTYPYHYREEVLTGKKQEVYYINFINKRIGLFDFKKFNSYEKEKNIITRNILLPISLIKERQYEVNVIDEIYTEEEVIEKGIKLGEDKLLSSNDKIINIEDVSIINKEVVGSSVRLELFVSVIEDVTKIKLIEVDT